MTEKVFDYEARIMLKKSELRELIDQALQDYSEAEKALEPDPNTDPVTYLDQQWRQERVSYVGMNHLDNSRPMANPIALVIFFLMFFGAGIMLWIEASRLPISMLYCGSIFFILTSLLILWALRNAIRLMLAERRYLKKRAILIKQYGDPTLIVELPVATRRLRYSWPKKSRSEAETRFHELQAEYYNISRRDQAYNDQIRRLIAHAPEADQRYLSELAQLEQDWVKQRFGNRRFISETEYYQAPSLFGAWIILGLGLGLVAFGVMLAVEGHKLLSPMLCCAFGLLMVASFSTIRKQATELDQAEQQYFAQRQRISHDYGR